MSSDGAPTRVRRQITARLSLRNSSSKSCTPRSRERVPSLAHSRAASSVIPNDGSGDVAAPPAAQWASWRRSPSPATALAMSAAALSPSTSPHRPSAIWPSYEPRAQLPLPGPAAPQQLYGEAEVHVRRHDAVDECRHLVSCLHDPVLPYLLLHAL
eukprot:3111136-Pleurochrysis_carterae.AAC.1